MRLIVATSRSIPAGVAMLIVDAALRVHRLVPTEIVCGKAGGRDAPDTVAELWARERRVTVRPVWADWSQPEGGIPDRNERMTRRATHMVAVWDGKSVSTGGLIDQARRRGLAVIVLHVEASEVTAARADERRRELALEKRLHSAGRRDPRPRRRADVRSAA